MKPVTADATYSFCESMNAAPWSRWHIRKRTDKGPKFGGGADTAALCGRNVAWDLDVVITAQHLSHACPACVTAYKDTLPL